MAASEIVSTESENDSLEWLVLLLFVPSLSLESVVGCRELLQTLLSALSESSGLGGERLDSGDCVPGGGGGDSFLPIGSGGVVELSLYG